ncbi:uncharacterized protein LOC142329171 isoform X1 [Lycorma delicatula]|uniref:uncharacterized protein LOC142329171 isoform X1 n=1 Tax=Lycorma delicatula TaxID=130591 RepID=UPI003F5133E5
MSDSVVKNGNGKPVKQSQRILIRNTYYSLKERNPYATVKSVAQTVAKNFGIGVASVFRVLKEFREKGVNVTPCRRRKKSKAVERMDEYTKYAIGRKVDEFYCRQEIPTVKNVLRAVNEDCNLPNYSRSTFYRILKSFKNLETFYLEWKTNYQPPEPENKRKKRNRENAQLQPQQEQLEIKCNLISTDAPTPISENERTTQTDVHESCPIQQAQNTPDEFEAIAINVAAKLRKMAPTQQILAEGLIQTVLQKGIFEELTRFTCLAEENTLVNNCDNLPTTSVTYFDAPVSYSPCSTVESSTVACKQEIIVTNIESLN